MTADEHRQVLEDNEKEMIILTEILRLAEEFGDDWKVRLMRMEKRELKSLANDVKGAPTLQERRSKILKALSDFEHAQKRKEGNKDDGSPPPRFDF